MKTIRTALFLSLLAFGFLSMNFKDGNHSTMAKGGILVIPFHPSMYFNSNDQFICQANNITPAELSSRIRAGVCGSMLDKLYGNYPSDTISSSGGSKIRSDVDRLYGIANYGLEEKPILAYYNKVMPGTKGEKSIFNFNNKKNEPEYLNPAKPNLKKHRYYKVSFKDTATYRNIIGKYGVSYVLFIDHFEMETSFKDCVEMHNNVSKRDLYVHYTLLDDKGKFKDGGVVCLTYQSSSNNVQELLKGTLPDLAGMILQEIKPNLK